MKIKMGLKKICISLIKISVKKGQCAYLASMCIMCIMLLCSCQKQPKITIYAGGPTTQLSTDDFKIVHGNYEEVLERWQERLKQVEKGSLEEAEAYSFMGGIYAEYLRDEESALLYLNKAIEIHQKKKDEVGLANDYLEMSKIYIYIGGDSSTGIDYLQKAEQIYDEHDLEDSINLAGILINKGHLYEKQEKHEESLEALIKAQAIYEKKQKNNITLNILIGRAYLRLQEYDLAKDQYLKAQQICKNENDEYMMSGVMFQMGALYEDMQEYDRAIEYYNQTLDYNESSEFDYTDTGTAYNNTAYCYDQISDTEKALDFSIKACRIIEAREPVTDRTIESKYIFKHNLSVYWNQLYGSTSQAEFDNWYQEIVIEEKDWRDSDVEKKRMSEK